MHELNIRLTEDIHLPSLHTVRKMKHFYFYIYVYTYTCYIKIGMSEIQ